MIISSILLERLYILMVQSRFLDLLEKDLNQGQQLVQEQSISLDMFLSHNVILVQVDSVPLVEEQMYLDLILQIKLFQLLSLVDIPTLRVQTLILDPELQYSLVLLGKNITQEQKLDLEQFEYQALLLNPLYLKPILVQVDSVPLVEEQMYLDLILQIKLFQLLSLVLLRISRIPILM